MLRLSVIVITITVFLFSAAGVAWAACTMPDGQEGEFFFNDNVNAPQVCTPLGWVALGILNPGAGGGGCSNPDGKTGEIFYNANVHVPQYCDGDDWREMIGVVNGCQAPQDCPSVGDVCADGSLFAGFLSDPADGSCRIIYVTDNNQSTSIQWKTSTGANDITDPDDPVDGQYNRDNRGSGTFPAFELCENNSYHGKSDWYLPARAELNLLWLNRAAINANAVGNFTGDYYWASTEDETDYAWQQNFGYAVQTNSSKTSYNDVRCIRSVDSIGGGGQTDCPNIGDVCSDGSVYAGLSPDGDVPMYTTSADGGQFSWNDGNGTGQTTTNQTSATTGEANTNNLITIDSDSGVGGTQPHQAAQYCADLNLHGQTDWYLPAKDELNVLYVNRSAIGGFNTSGSWTVGYYWSSSETTNYGASTQVFSDGSQPAHGKDHGLSVRCVRKE